jgi:ATP-dependent DNA helicase RecQ
MGFLDIDHSSYGALKLSPSSRAVLKGEQSVTLRKQVEKKSLRDGRGKESAASPVAQLDSHGKSLFEALRAWRAAAAKEHAVPAYVIFHDATLAEIAHLAPQSAQQLRRISGIGARKLEIYGAALIEICQAHGENPHRQHVTAAAQKKTAPVSQFANLSESASQTLQSLREGATISEIARMRSLKETTLYSHCAEAISQNLLQAHEVLPLSPSEMATLRAAILAQHAAGETKLKPIFEFFNERYDYGVLRCMAAELACKH